MKIIESNLKLINKLKKLNSPSIIVIHHAAHSSATVNEIRRWHGFGYHFLVTKDVRVHRVRTENAIGAHTKGHEELIYIKCP